MRYVVIIFLLFVVGCSEPVIIDTDLQPYVDEFVKDAAERGKSVTVDYSVVFGYADGNTGICKHDDELVIIDESMRNSNYLKWVVFHELGHAFLGRGHCDNEINGHPESIMHYSKARKVTDEYLNELFK